MASDTRKWLGIGIPNTTVLAAEREAYLLAQKHALWIASTFHSTRISGT